jgi:hypothetical protein
LNVTLKENTEFIKLCLLTKKGYNSFVKLNEAKEYLTENKDIKRIIKSMEDKARRNNINEFIKRRIEYKITG